MVFELSLFLNHSKRWIQPIIKILDTWNNAHASEINRDLTLAQQYPLRLII